MPRPQQHEFLPATGEDFNALALEGDEAMEEDMEQEGYGMYHELIAFTSFLSVSLYMWSQSNVASSTPTSSLTWIVWFCQLPGHEYFCEVSEDFIEDDFNLTGLNSMVPFWKEAMEMVLDVEPGVLSSV